MNGQANFNGMLFDTNNFAGVTPGSGTTAVPVG